eukprot:TRINITY_DN92051_c0_g1_i1.p1 TRINITY_DN92051_c0_g1~~TRINITY_DN92051_c0_g1_i1.p1  ORF type:complete len:306 (+),score=56.18 TRINITY_DN92051_c0_g1_i1:33-950(+)
MAPPRHSHTTSQLQRPFLTRICFGGLTVACFFKNQLSGFVTQRDAGILVRRANTGPQPGRRLLSRSAAAGESGGGKPGLDDLASLEKFLDGVGSEKEDAPRGGDPPPEAPRWRDPPPETGRNPLQVGTDLANGLVMFPVIILGGLALVAFNIGISASRVPPPQVPLSEGLSYLIAIEDDYDARGPSIGLRERLTKWFQRTEPKRRLDYELQGLPAGPARAEADKRGRDAAEYIAAVMEYNMAGNGIQEDSGFGARYADRVAAEQASKGYPEAEKFAEQGLREGRRALADAVRAIEEAEATARDRE